MSYSQSYVLLPMWGSIGVRKATRMLRILRGTGGQTPVAGDALRQLISEHNIIASPADKYLVLKVKQDLQLPVLKTFDLTTEWEPRPKDVDLYVSEDGGLLTYLYTAFLE